MSDSYYTVTLELTFDTPKAAEDAYKALNRARLNEITEPNVSRALDAAKTISIGLGEKCGALCHEVQS